MSRMYSGHGGLSRGMLSGRGHRNPERNNSSLFTDHPRGRRVNGFRGASRRRGRRQGNLHERVVEPDEVKIDECPLQILEPVGGQWTLHVKNLEAILLHPDIKDRHLVIVSVVGKFRLGKSFLMSVLLNHLKRGKENEKWLLEEKCVSLAGFEWKNTIHPVTSGILMWSKAFPLDLPSGEKIGVVLMDTQGTFDLERPAQESATIFAISTMISSIQIYNLQSKIGRDDLDHFTYFVEYGSVAQRQVGAQQQATVHPFQHLHFLIRDWTNSTEFSCGHEGGNSYLEDVYTKGEGPGMKKTIDSCFTNTECSLLPHPGADVTTGPIIDQQVPDMDTEFRKHLANFVVRLLDPSRMVVKTIGGQPIKPQAFIKCIEAYASFFSSDKIPDSDSYFNLSANATHVAAVDKAVDKFHTEMDAAFGGRAPSTTPKNFDERTEKFAHQAYQVYRDAPTLGNNSERDEKFRKLLQEAITRIIDSKRSINDSKLFKEKMVAEKKKINKMKQAAAAERKKETNKLIKRLEMSLFQMKLDFEKTQSNQTDAEIQRIVLKFMKDLKDSIMSQPRNGKEHAVASIKYVQILHNELDVLRDALNRQRDSEQDEANRVLENLIRAAQERETVARNQATEAQEQEWQANQRLLQAEARDRAHQEKGWLESTWVKVAFGVGAAILSVAGAVVYITVPGIQPVINEAVVMAQPLLARFLPRLL